MKHHLATMFLLLASAEVNGRAWIKRHPVRFRLVATAVLLLVFWLLT